MRETQQHRAARPGHSQPFPQMTPEETYLISPQGTPQSQVFDSGCFDSLPSLQDQTGMGLAFDQFNGPVNMMMMKAQADFHSIPTTQDFELFASDSALSTPTFNSFQESPSMAQGWTSEGETASTRRSSRRISNGIMDRVSKFEHMGLDGAMERPNTPPTQNAKSE